MREGEYGEATKPGSPKRVKGQCPLQGQGAAPLVGLGATPQLLHRLTSYAKRDNSAPRALNSEALSAQRLYLRASADAPPNQHYP